MTCLPASRRRDRGARVQVVGNADIHDLAAGLGERPIEIGEPPRDAVLRGEGPRALLAPRVDGDDLGFGHEARVRLGVNVGDEAGADQGNFVRLISWIV